MTFSKILIANRGEISCRITRTAHRMGIHTVAVYSDADTNALHVQCADEAVYLGPSPSRESYLRIDAVITAAKATGVEAIHPGYGFLSENADFARACLNAGLVFIGPPPNAITAMGSKSDAKALMEKAGVPLIPGYHGDNQNAGFLLEQAHVIGFPVLLKASAGGGGKGMREVHHEREFHEALLSAQREALNAFGDQRMLIEKLLVKPRHVEVQILADRYGNAVYIFDRDCSIQRRHQKVVEEAPAPGLDNALRQTMGEAAVRAAQAIHYEGAGTLEFLVDHNGQFYFMEMNTRLQVEHPVSEMISVLDLVEQQLRIANGEKLSFTQADLKPQGHAIEVRLYAEDPQNEFLPSIGTLRRFDIPTGEYVRVDTGYCQGDVVTMYYDPMMAKVIAWGENREQAINHLLTTLRQTCIAGLHHNNFFLTQVLTHPDFKAGHLGTHFIDAHQTELFQRASLSEKTLLLLAAQCFLRASMPTDSASPWQALAGFRIGQTDAVTIKIRLYDKIHPVALTPENSGYRYECLGKQGVCSLDLLSITTSSTCGLTVDTIRHNLDIDLNANCLDVYYNGEHIELQRIIDLKNNHSGTTANDHHYHAPMNGRIISVSVKVGDNIKAGDTLLVMEAMKMEHRIRAHRDGRVQYIEVAIGDLVSENRPLLELEIETV